MFLFSHGYICIWRVISFTTVWFVSVTERENKPGRAHSTQRHVRKLWVPAVCIHTLPAGPRLVALHLSARTKMSAACATRGCD